MNLVTIVKYAVEQGVDSLAYRIVHDNFEFVWDFENYVYAYEAIVAELVISKGK